MIKAEMSESMDQKMKQRENDIRQHFRLTYTTSQ